MSDSQQRLGWRTGSDQPAAQSRWAGHNVGLRTVEVPEEGRQVHLRSYIDTSRWLGQSPGTEKWKTGQPNNLTCQRRTRLILPATMTLCLYPRSEGALPYPFAPAANPPPTRRDTTLFGGLVLTSI